MGYDWKSSGTVPIKAGVTLAELVNAFYRIEDAENPDAYDPAREQPYGYELRDDIDFSYDATAGELTYTADSNSGHLHDVWSAYLDELAQTFARAGWESYSSDDEEPDFYGSSPEAERAAKLTHYVATIEHAVAAIKATLAEITPQEA
jgi:hypothetical protein